MGNTTKLIIEKGNLLEVAKEYKINFKKSGNNYKALCPFHQEKTPSFFINPSKNVYHCFGCNKSGNIITFVAEIEKISHQDAVRKLAHKLNIPLSSEIQAGEDSKTQKLLEEYAIFLNSLLRKPENSKIIKYLYQRGLDDDTINKYLIGYTPADIKDHSKFLEHQDIFIKCGIWGNEEGNIYSILRHRIVFPIFDYLGRIVAFGGRAIEENQQPKYLNTRENKWFEKRCVFYGHKGYLNDIEKTKTAIIVEGYFDQILLNKFGFNNAIAILGSAFTQNHADFLSKYTNKVFFYLDEDEAGLKSTLSLIDIIINTNFDTFYINSKTGLDPSEYIQQYGATKFAQLLNNAKPLIEFYFEYISNKINTTTNINEKALLLDEAINKISKVNHPLKKELLISQFCQIFNEFNKSIQLEVNALKQKLKEPTNFNPFYLLPKANEVQQKAMCELEAELIFLIANDKSLKQKSIELKLCEYIIHSFFRNLYEQIINSKDERAIDITELLQQNQDRDATEYTHFLYKLLFLEDYEITQERFMMVAENLKKCYLSQCLTKIENNNLEEILNMKRRAMEL
jgi:DNA primase